MQRFQKLTPDLSDKSRSLGLNDAKFWAERLGPQPEGMDRETFLKDHIEAVIRCEPMPYLFLDEEQCSHDHVLANFGMLFGDDQPVNVLLTRPSWEPN